MKETALNNPGLAHVCQTCDAKIDEPCRHQDGEIVNDVFVMHLSRYNKWQNSIVDETI
jgi:hypothetical protein